MASSRHDVDTRQPLLNPKNNFEALDLEALASMPTDDASRLPSWYYNKDSDSSSPALQRLADSRWVPTRRLWRLVGRRPLLLLIAFGTTVLTLGLLFLSRSEEDPTSWLEPLEPLFFDPSSINTPATTRPLPVKALSSFTPQCLEAWIARGEVCSYTEGLEVLQAGARDLIPVDAVWTWVNGSDTRHTSERAFWQGKGVDFTTYISKRAAPTQVAPLAERDETPSLWSRFVKRAPAPKKAEKWFRDHDELRYSVRSVRSHVKSVRKSYILATDFPYPYSAPGTGQRLKRQGIYSDVLRLGAGGDRQGQWPQWLDPHSWWTRKSGEEMVDGGVGVYHHWDFFRPPSTVTDVTAWKHSILPTFNSFAIESQIPNLPGLGEVFLYMNDDFFIGQDLATSDFYSPVYGTVYRLQGDLGVDPLEYSRSDPSGEWPQLHRSNWLLSERFGRRKRPYITHATKTFNYPLLHESRLMFEDGYALTSTHRFRGLGPDIVGIYLVAYMNIERHREALLWSFFMAKMDRDGDGYFSATERRAIVEELTRGDHDGDRVKELLPKRHTLNGNQSSVDAVLDAVQFPRKQQTTYSFSSQDGYPLLSVTKSKMNYEKTFGNTWPDFYRVSDTTERDACAFSLSVCFPEGSSTDASELTNAGTVLKRFAFDKIECGDCLITHLINGSGKRGMSAFLPPDDLFFPGSGAIDILDRSVAPESEPEPESTTESGSLASEHQHGEPAAPAPIAFLPVTAGGSWRDVDYSLPTVQELTHWPSSSSRREFAMQLIQRYSYVIGESLVEFLSLRSNAAAQNDMNRLRRTKPAFACINDDIMPGQNRVDSIFSSWLQETFPDPLPYEKSTTTA